MLLSRNARAGNLFRPARGETSRLRPGAGRNDRHIDPPDEA
jgi:hypothetical protein